VGKEMSFVNYHTHSFVVILGLLILVEETHCISARHTKYALKFPRTGYEFIISGYFILFWVLHVIASSTL